MGRELRMVRADWQHPKDAKGHYIPLMEGSFSERVIEWDIGEAQWRKGLRRDYSNQSWRPIESQYSNLSFEDWYGKRPLAKDYMPDWTESERTHFQMYENTTEGTPISPVMSSPESLARWLADNGASAFGGATATYSQWLATIRSGYAVGMVVSGGTLMSGVEFEGIRQ